MSVLAPYGGDRGLRSYVSLDPYCLQREMAKLSQPRSAALAVLTHLIEVGDEISNPPVLEVLTDPPRSKWKDELAEWRVIAADELADLYGLDVAKTFDSKASATDVFPLTVSHHFTPEIEAAREALEYLESLRDSLSETEAPPEPPATVEPEPVFVVHGRDTGLQAQVARTIEQLGLEAVILSERSNRGNTLVEKLEAEGRRPNYAVVILSPDAFARGPDEKWLPSSPNRARQNVILELGYFIGKLGRCRVCALHVQGIDLPSDIDGLAYIPLDDAGAWKFRLGNELRAAAYSVDLNRLKL